jgi:hypothetical protein
MHEVNWCENCGSMIRLQVARDGRTELVDHFVCDCRGRPRPAEKADSPRLS